MSYLLLVFVLLLLVLLAFIVLTQKKTSGMARTSHAQASKCRFLLKRKQLLTGREIDCYKLLVKELGPEFIVFPQVAFSQILNVTGGTQSENRKLWMTMSQKVADFVICKDDLTMLAILELDDRSHQGKQDKDRTRDGVVESVGLKALRIAGPAKQEDIARIAMRLRGMACPQPMAAGVTLQPPAPRRDPVPLRAVERDAGR
ncbi:Uncharacterized protein ChrSV_2946 [Chromobacterium vaccinii]|nr:DUF2726 domain-containing protein [Chromobacterium vaccinii]QND85172.1 Uncharacterized protein ChrSW_2946 [Chromobacterium vaccinii]QND90393.1 DUF2726 domain-containing protein [Chromobacterium vaccinii]QND90403.1 Uncharacterized protein ChrSV_2946 [Chromobacterium vaccinii]